MSSSTPVPVRPRSHLSIQASVIRALILRELQDRFGRDNIGYLWVIGEPLMLATVISTLHYVGGHATGESTSMQPFPFTVLGYCFFIIFRNIFNRSESAIEMSLPLLYHRIITPLDIMYSKIIVDILGCVSSCVVLMTIGIMLGIADFPVRPLYVFFGLFQICWISLGSALVVASYTYEGHLLKRFVHPFTYFMMPLSGAFITMNILPIWARSFMAWNPLMSIFETIRYGQFPNAESRYIFPGYTMAVSAGLTYWGLIAIRRMSRRITVR